MAIKWTKKDVIKAFEEAMSPTPQKQPSQLVQRLIERAKGKKTGEKPIP